MSQSPACGWADSVLDTLNYQNGVQPVVTGPTGRFTVTGIHPAIEPLELQAVPQPGMPYVMAQEVVDGQSDLVIECTRGIPFRLKVVDDSGTAVDASRGILTRSSEPISRRPDSRLPATTATPSASP